MTIKSAQSRILYLDSIRGIAAMMVVFFHFINMRWSETVSGKAAVVIFNGSDAVSFFFVLSGFVLSYRYLQNDMRISVLHYLKKRIVRLYPAYIITVLVCFVYHNRLRLNYETFYEAFVLNEGPKIWNELAMIMPEHHMYFPGWALRVEIVYSILIIPLILIAKKNKWLLIPVVLGSFVIGERIQATAMLHFVLGIVIGLNYAQWSSKLFRESKAYPYRFALFGILFFLYSLQQLKYFIPEIKTIMDTLWPFNLRWSHFSAVSAFFILVMIIQSPQMQKALENSLLLFLGKISYSIYLVHWIIVMGLIDYWDLWANFLGAGILRFVVMFSVYVISTIILGYMMYNYIEAPFIKLGRKKIPWLSDVKV